MDASESEWTVVLDHAFVFAEGEDPTCKKWTAILDDLVGPEDKTRIRAEQLSGTSVEIAVEDLDYDDHGDERWSPRDHFTLAMGSTEERAISHWPKGDGGRITATPMSTVEDTTRVHVRAWQPKAT